MQVVRLIKLLFWESKKNIFFAFFLFVVVDFVYFNFTGIAPNNIDGVTLWLGGNDYRNSLSTILLKLLNASIIFLTIGRIIDKLTSDIILYIMVRITDYKGFILRFTLANLLLGCMLTVMSHLIYYSFARTTSIQNLYILEYLLMECLGVCGLLLIYIIFNNVMLIENSILFIMGIYILNTILPFPFVLATATMDFVDIGSRMGFVPLLLVTIALDTLIASIYYGFILKRSVSIC